MLSAFNQLLLVSVRTCNNFSKFLRFLVLILICSLPIDWMTHKALVMEQLRDKLSQVKNFKYFCEQNSSIDTVSSL